VIKIMVIRVEDDFLRLISLETPASELDISDSASSSAYLGVPLEIPFRGSLLPPQDLNMIMDVLELQRQYQSYRRGGRKTTEKSYTSKSTASQEL
jgi:hypothetical protein